MHIIRHRLVVSIYVDIDFSCLNTSTSICTSDMDLEESMTMNTAIATPSSSLPQSQELEFQTTSQSEKKSSTSENNTRLVCPFPGCGKSFKASLWGPHNMRHHEIKYHNVPSKSTSNKSRAGPKFRYVPVLVDA